MKESARKTIYIYIKDNIKMGFKYKDKNSWIGLIWLKTGTSFRLL